MAISCVAEKTASISPVTAMLNNACWALSCDITTQHTAMPSCRRLIQPRRWPSQSGLILSNRGDHRKLIEYTAKIAPKRPMADRDNPSSLSQADITEPIITQGKPLEIPNRKTLSKRRSRNDLRVCSKTESQQRVLRIGSRIPLRCNQPVLKPSLLWRGYKRAQPPSSLRRRPQPLSFASHVKQTLVFVGDGLGDPHLREDDGGRSG